MGKFQVTQKAVADLTEIWNYTSDHWSEQQADKSYEDLISECKFVADNPTIGKNANDLTPGLLCRSINRHIIFYRRVEGSSIEVQRILHERIEPKRRLGNFYEQQSR